MPQDGGRQGWNEGLPQCCRRRQGGERKVFPGKCLTKEDVRYNIPPTENSAGRPLILGRTEANLEK